MRMPLHRISRRLCVSIALLLVFWAETRAQERNPLDILFPCEWAGNIDKVKFPEPSGIVYHPQRGTLFVVGDEGDICEIRTDGALVKQAHVRKADFEGITCVPATGLLYLAIEGEEKIVEMDPETFTVLREFAIERTFHGATVLKAGGQGIEGITFVSAPGHPEGGTFYVANQSFSLNSPEDPSAIFEVEVPLKDRSAAPATVKSIRCITPGVIDLSGLHYDAKSDHLYAISDATNAFFEMTRDGKILRSYALPGDDQEGITVDDKGFLYIAQDSGGIIKLKPMAPR